MLSACGISIEKQLVQFNGRVLNPPKVRLEDKKRKENISLIFKKWNR